MGKDNLSKTKQPPKGNENKTMTFQKDKLFFGYIGSNSYNNQRLFRSLSLQPLKKAVKLTKVPVCLRNTDINTDICVVLKTHTLLQLDFDLSPFSRHTFQLTDHIKTKTHKKLTLEYIDYQTGLDHKTDKNRGN